MSVQQGLAEKKPKYWAPTAMGHLSNCESPDTFCHPSRFLSPVVFNKGCNTLKNNGEDGT